MSISRAATTSVDVPRGLAGVVVTDTELGDVRGLEGFYHYRQYSAVELAQARGFEDVWHLLVHGELPDAVQRAEFAGRTAELRRLPDEVRAALPAIAAATGHSGPLAGLRTALSLLGASLGFRPVYDIDAGRRRADTLAACAAVPTLLTALYRLGQGLEPVEPREDLAYAANYLYMLTGSEPDDARTRAIEQYLISTIDHGFNASTFTARVIASTGADVAACLVGAVGALSGPLHGGAPSRALDTLDAIGTPDRIDPWIRERVLAGERIMGFGHPVYRTEDPARACSAASHEGSAARWSTSPSRSNARWKRSWPNSSPAASCTPTWSSTRAWSWNSAGCLGRCSRLRSPPPAWSDGARTSWNRRRTRRSFGRRLGMWGRGRRWQCLRWLEGVALTYRARVQEPADYSPRRSPARRF